MVWGPRPHSINSTSWNRTSMAEFNPSPKEVRSANITGGTQVQWKKMTFMDQTLAKVYPQPWTEKGWLSTFDTESGPLNSCKQMTKPSNSSNRAESKIKFCANPVKRPAYMQQYQKRPEYPSRANQNARCTRSETGNVPTSQRPCLTPRGPIIMHHARDRKTEDEKTREVESRQMKMRPITHTASHQLKAWGSI